MTRAVTVRCRRNGPVGLVDVRVWKWKGKVIHLIVRDVFGVEAAEAVEVFHVRERRDRPFFAGPFKAMYLFCGSWLHREK